MGPCADFRYRVRRQRSDRIVGRNQEMTGNKVLIPEPCSLIPVV
jgi:hypothetical protein